jgi:hypothetical protein
MVLPAVVDAEPGSAAPTARKAGTAGRLTLFEQRRRAIECIVVRVQS